MNDKEHKERHELLHRMLDELLADFLAQTGKLPSQVSVVELMEWSYQQTLQPTPLEKELGE
jgi:hypothetical protein